MRERFNKSAISFLIDALLARSAKKEQKRACAFGKFGDISWSMSAVCTHFLTDLHSFI